MSPGPVLRFGAFELDRGTGGLRKHGLRVRMQEQPLRILTMLLERPGEIVTREELVKALWPDGTFVDSERSLNSAVTRLRQVLADSAENPRYVETMSRRGYRFIAPVEELTSAEPERAVAREAPKPAHWRNIMRLAWPVGVAVITIVAAVVYSARTPGDPFREPYTVLPLTRLPGNERDPSFSPDGREVVFAWDRGQNGPSDLYVKRIGDETLLPLTRSGGNDRSPAWSPDGRSIAFLRISPTRISVLLVPALPGPERTVAEMPRWNDADYIETVSYLGWSADGKWLVIPNHESLADRVGLSAIAPETGEMRALTRPPKEWIGDFSPALSPDARRLSFVRLAGIGTSDLYEIALTDDLKLRGEAKRMRLNGSAFSNAVWTGDGRHLVAPMWLTDGAWRVYQVKAVKPEQPHLLGSLGEDARYLAISYQARRLAFSREYLDINIWRVEVAESALRSGVRKNSGNQARQLVASTTDDALPQYSPDGTKIAFNSDRSGAPEVWVCDSDGTHPRPVTSLRARLSRCARWSPDGHHLAFHSRRNAQARIYTVEVSTGAVRPLTNDDEDNCCASWSRDGRWVYFNTRRSGLDEIWKVPAGGGQPVQVTRNGGVFAFESFDGQYLYYTKVTGSGVWRMPVAGGSEERIVQRGHGCDWVATPSGIWFIADNLLQVFRFSTGKIAEIAPIAKPAGRGISVSPDERSILYTQIDRKESDLMLVEEFP